VTETQVGRWSALSAPPLSFHEYLSLRGLDPGPAVPELDLVAGGTISAKALTKAVDALSRAMEVFPAYLAAGGMPWLAQQTDAAASRSVMREDVAESILRRDVGLHFGARNVEDLKRLFVFLCLHSGEVFPVQRYAKAVETSAATVANHVELLERCFLVRRLPPVATRGEEVQKARFRVFVTDTTLRNSELLRDADHLHDGDDMRRVVGTCVVRHVVERHARSLARISYWRDARTRRAVDVVVQDVDGTAIFHSMYGPPTQVTDRDCPAHFSRSEGVKRAFLVTRDEDDVGVLRLPGLETEFVKVPAHVVAYLLGRAESKAATP
jgi:predicted AAA+ superfamily ATPase